MAVHHDAELHFCSFDVHLDIAGGISRPNQSIASLLEESSRSSLINLTKTPTVPKATPTAGMTPLTVLNFSPCQQRLP
jgi:hypothetical protein